MYFDERVGPINVYFDRYSGIEDSYVHLSTENS